MKTSIRKKIKKFMVEYSKYSHWHKAAVCMAAVVAVFTISALVLPAVTIGHDTYCGKVEHVHTKECYKEQLICGYGETSTPAHVHTDSCYIEESTLSCTLAETPGHTHTQECISSEERLICTDISPEHAHTAECYETVETYICGQEESAGHTHTDACYQTEKVLNCTAGETTTNHQHTEECYEKVLTCTKEEHTHSVQCYANPRADVETQAVWEQTMANVELSGDWSEDLITIAKTQLGYHESKANYMISEQNEVKGYSRYGAWYGDTHGDWSAMFVSFCLRYAQIPSEQFISEDDCGEWINWLANAGMYQSAGSYRPVAGDIVFIDYDENGAADHAGIVEAVNDKEIGTIEGDSEDSVCRRTYSLTDVKLIGYGVLPEEPKQETETAETESTANKETPETETANTKKKSAKRYAVSVPGVASADAANVEAAGEGTVQARGTELNFSDYIKEVKLQYSSFYYENWQDVTPDTKLEPNDRLKFEMKYTIEGNQLSQDNKEVVYKLPANINKVNASSGTVKNASGMEVGDYIITEDGEIRVIFNDEFVKSNQEGKAISGSIFFYSSVDNIKKEEDGTIKLPFKDSIEVDLQIKDQGKSTEDLKVEKTASDVNQAEGTVKYTINVTSKNGTSDAVLLQDVMDQMAVKGGTFTVTDKNGNSVANIQVPADGADRFEMTLPKMNGGDKYTITYTAKLKSELVNGTINANNKVNVSSENSNKEKLIHSAEAKTEFKKEVLEKKGEAQSNGKVKWTITVNKGKADISGWELSDVLDGQKFEGTVDITPAVEGKTQIKLPYKFPSGSNQTYTITYETSTDRQPGQGNIQNTATLTNPNNPNSGNQPSAGANPWIGYYNPLTKTAESMTETGDPRTITWKVIINADQGDIKAPWTYTDELKNGQWYTKAQMDAIEVTLKEEFNGFDLELKPVLMDGETEKYKGFEVTFKKDLKKGSKHEFTYTSTAPLGDGTEAINFTNSASINKKAWSGGSIKYMPKDVKVEKYDASNWNGGEKTSHDFQKDGTISWDILVYVPEGYAGGLTVIEKLPDGVTLQDPLKIKIRNQEGSLTFGESSEVNSTISDDHVNQPIRGTKKSDGSVEIYLSEGAVASATKGTTQIGNENRLNTIHLKVNVKLDDTIAWDAVEGDAKKECKVLNNEVIVKDKTGTKLDTDIQTQTITKDKENDVIQKSSAGIDDNTIPYSIIINAESKDLLEKAETLTLKDTVSLYNDKGIRLSLVPNSVKVYYRNPDGTRGSQLPASECPYTYTAEENVNPMLYKLSIQIPDEKALIVEYSYKASGAVGANAGQVSNTAMLEGVTGETGKSETKIDIKITQSDVTADFKGATLCKVDADNNGIRLAGAGFRLSRWDADQQRYVEVTQTGDGSPLEVTTRSDGMFEIELAYNTAYELVETQAPEGYTLDSKPYYFFIKNSDEINNPPCKPNGFQGEEKLAGSVIYYPNTKEKMEVTVKKQWRDPDGGPVTGTTPGSVQFELWRKNTVGGAGATLSGELNYIWDAGLLQSFSSESYAPGTVLEFTFKTYHPDHQWNGNTPQITFNGENVAGVFSKGAQNEDGKPELIFTYRITLRQGQNTLKGNIPRSLASSKWEYSGLQVVSSPEVSVNIPAEEKVGNSIYTLSSESGWEYTIDNLPKQTVYDNGQTVVKHSYFVKEIDTGANYEVSYSCSGNDTYVLWTITNKKPENPAHELPETGGIGTTPYTLAGIVLIAIAFLLYINKKIIIKK